MGSGITENGVLLFPSEFLAAEDLHGRDVTVTIQSLKKEPLRVRGGATKAKLIIWFKGAQKKFVANPTNQETIRDLYGKEITKWIGKAITLYPTTCPFGPKTVNCTRIRDKAPSGNGTGRAPAPVEPPPQAAPSNDAAGFMDSPAPPPDGKLLDDGMPSWQEFH